MYELADALTQLFTTSKDKIPREMYYRSWQSTMYVVGTKTSDKIAIGNKYLTQAWTS